MAWFWIGCSAAGVSLFLTVWRVGNMLARSVETKARRQRPVLAGEGWWRWAGPWLIGLGRRLLPRLSWGLRRTVEDRMRQAGLGTPWTLDAMLGAMGTAGLSGCVFVLSLIMLLTPDGMPGWRMALAGAALGLGGGTGLLWHGLLQRSEKRRQQMAREFPFLLDLITLCVEAGQNLHGALQQAASHGPEGPLRQELQLALQRMRTGQSRAQALDDLVRRCNLPVLAQWTDAVQQADRLGMSLGPLLRAQAAQQRSERFLRAETLAMQAPVKMLLPLVTCLFPCTFLMLGFPIGTLLLQALQ